MSSVMKTGAILQGGNGKERREAARMMGSVKSEAKTAAVRENAKLGGRPKGMKMSAASRAKLCEYWAHKRSEKLQAS